MCPKFKPSIICINKLSNTSFSELMFSIHLILLTHLICLEIAKNCHNDSKTYLLFAYKQSTQNSRCYKEPPANICRLISNSIATSVFVFICSILLRLSFYLKSVNTNSVLFVVCLIFKDIDQSIFVFSPLTS